MQRRTIACNVLSSRLASSSHVKVSSDNRNALRSTQDASGSVRKHQEREQSARGAFSAPLVRQNATVACSVSSSHVASERPRAPQGSAPKGPMQRQNAPGRSREAPGTPGYATEAPDTPRIRQNARGVAFSTPEDHLMGQRLATGPQATPRVRGSFHRGWNPLRRRIPRRCRTPPRRAYGASSVERRCALGPSRRRLGRRHGRRTLQTPVAFSLGFRV